MKNPAQDYECVDISDLCNTTFDILYDHDESDARVGDADLAWRGHTFGFSATHPHGEPDQFKHLSRPFVESRDLIIDKLSKHGISS